MSSAIKQLKASARAQGGKGAARAVRRANRIPAVIYGGGEAPQPISLDQKEAQLLIFAGHFLTTLFEIEIDGKKQRAIPRDYQLDPVKDTPLHIDFLRLKEGQKIRVEVPVHVLNQETSPGVKRGGGNAGHNGLRSITHLCGNDYRRVRIGIGHPGDKALVHHYVLGNFAKDEQEGVRDLCDALADPLALLLEGQDSAYQQAVNAAMD